VLKHSILAYVIAGNYTNFALQQITSVPFSLILMIDTFFTRIVLKMLSFSTWREFKNDCIEGACEDDSSFNWLKRTQSRPACSGSVSLVDKRPNPNKSLFLTTQKLRLIGNSNFESSG
jgi:hypothetical protein